MEDDWWLKDYYSFTKIGKDIVVIGHHSAWVCIVKMTSTICNFNPFSWPWFHSQLIEMVSEIFNRLLLQTPAGIVFPSLFSGRIPLPTYWRDVCLNANQLHIKTPSEIVTPAGYWSQFNSKHTIHRKVSNIIYGIKTLGSHTRAIPQKNQSRWYCSW